MAKYKKIQFSLGSGVPQKVLPETKMTRYNAQRELEDINTPKDKVNDDFHELEKEKEALSLLVLDLKKEIESNERELRELSLIHI